MKYKIIKKSSKTLKKIYDLNDQSHFEVKYLEWYEAKRKGRIFGFYHKVGHEYDYECNLISHLENTIEEMENYIHKWHEVKYSKYPIEIVKEINI